MTIELDELADNGDPEVTVIDEDPAVCRVPTKPLPRTGRARLEVELQPDADADALASFFEELASAIRLKRRIVLVLEP